MAQQTCSPFLDLIGSAKCIKQGAEAKVYKTVLFPSPTLTPAAAADASDSAAASSSASAALPPPVPVLLKHRFPKRYRHPHLDAQLTRLRVTSEARSLVRAARGGVSVPALRGVDVEAGIVGMEWIEGWSVREVLGGGAESDEAGGSDDEDGSEDAAASAEEETPAPEPWAGLDLAPMASLIGSQLALLHLADVIHGDLTTSNMMLRPSASGAYDLVMIDFGLAYMSTLWEDKAVDLYVLERAFSSTHPGSEGIFETILGAYEKGLGKSWKEIGRKLEEVRLRGRKRSMIG